MRISDRDELIDEYYAALDVDEPSEIVAPFTDDVVYRYPGEEPLEGRDAVEAFFAEGRPTSETTHTVTRRVHGEEATACDGHIAGTKEGVGSFEAEYAGFFEFDDEAGLISDVAVYSRPHP